MRKIITSIAAMACIGIMAQAGGDIAPVEPVVETPVVAPITDNGFYVGGAYGYGNVSVDGAAFDPNIDESYNAFMLLAGYKINPYVAVEGRYWWSSSSDFTSNGTVQSIDADAGAIYVKPMYPVTDKFDVYALLGYADTYPEVDGTGPGYDTDGFSWGLGASYNFNENVSFFVDYVSLYDDSESVNGQNEDITIDTWNFGVTYKF